jgi:hypothetical protein
MVELACPESCSYLQDARRSAGAREHEQRAREAAASGRPAPDVDQRSLVALLAVDSALVEIMRGVKGAGIKDLQDYEALAAIETTIKNFGTEQSGLIYEHRAPSPRVEDVSRRLRDKLDEINDRVPAESRLGREEIMKALHLISNMIESHMRRGAGPDSYVRFISLFFPWPEESTKPLII